MHSTKLGDIFVIQSGGTPSKSRPDFYENGDIPWIKTGDLKGKYISCDVDYITENGLKNSSAKLFPVNTVLVAMYGATIGACSILPFEASTNQACAAFLPNEKVLPEYLYYFLCANKESFIKDGVGGAQPNISAGYLKKVTFEIKSLSEQQQIVDILEKVKVIIDNRKQQLQQLDELAKARFVEMFDGKYETRTLGGVCEELFAGGDVKKEKSSDIQSVEHPYPIYTNGEKNNGLYGYTSIARVTKEAVTISGRGTIGFTCLRKEPFYPAVRLIVAIPNQELVSGCYLQHFVQSKNYGGQGASIPQLTVPMVKDELIPVPPMDLQEQFAIFVEQVDKSKVAVQKALDEAQTLFDSLMQEYFG